MSENHKHIKVSEATHKTFKDLAKKSGKTFMGYMESLAKRLGGKK
jgi:hypothetical protein